LILKPAPNKKKDDEMEATFTEEEQQAFKMLSPEQKKFLNELDQAGCSKDYLKKKIR
jgi:hypothetical protein